MNENIPASPEEKIWVRMRLARETGKFFDENHERRVYGLAPVENPVIILERAERTEMTIREDQAAPSLREEAGIREPDTTQGDAIDELRRMNEELQAQIRELTANPPSRDDIAAKNENAAAKEKADADLGKQQFPDGAPDKSWSKGQITKWLTHHNLPPAPPRSTPLGALDHALAAGAKAGLIEAPEADNN